MSGEATVIRAVVRVADRHVGPHGERTFHFNIGAGNGETGLCDRLLGYRGRTLWIETKDPKHGQVRPKQAWMAQRAAACGWIVLIVTDAEQVRAELRRIDEEERMTDTHLTGFLRPEDETCK